MERGEARLHCDKRGTRDISTSDCLAVGLKAQYDSATSGGACAVAERR